MTKSKVYFTRTITPKAMVTMYEVLEKELEGKVGIKLHSGEVGNQNFIGPYFWEEIINKVNGTVVECNTAYDGKRMYTKDHLETIKLHGWDKFNVEILDGDNLNAINDLGKDDLVLDIPNGQAIKKNYVGKKMQNYDSMLVLSHFKGHPMGGFGGALKQLSIGLASSYGKAYIHGAGVPEKIWTQDHDLFLKSMADAASSITNYFNGNIVYINVMKNMSVDCDCCAVAEDPCIKDIGMLISLDPVAIDKACLDLVYASDDPGKDHLIERIESRNGKLTVEEAEKLGIGSTNYELINID